MRRPRLNNNAAILDRSAFDGTFERAAKGIVPENADMNGASEFAKAWDGHWTKLARL